MTYKQGRVEAECIIQFLSFDLIILHKRLMLITVSCTCDSV